MHTGDRAEAESGDGDRTTNGHHRSAIAEGYVAVSVSTLRLVLVALAAQLQLSRRILASDAICVCQCPALTDTPRTIYRIRAARDPVLVVELEGGGLISYLREDWTMHTLNTSEGFCRKLRQLGIAPEAGATGS